MSTKNRHLLRKRIALYLAAGLLSCNLVYANPANPTLVQGSASIGNGANNILNITGVTNGTVINWGSFSIAAGETTTFAGSAPYAILNRVTGSDISQILGTLTADTYGKIFLVNQNGIVVGNGAVINTGAFIASTLNITDNAFTAYANGGNLIFDQANNRNDVNNGNSGTVALSGSIAATGGVTLLGSTVSVAPGVTFTVTNGDLSLLAAKTVDYDPQNNNSGLSYTATAANSITIGDSASAKGLNLTANNIILAGGAVTIAGPSTVTYSGSTDTTKNARINASDTLEIYSLNSKQESSVTTNNVTSYTSNYSADSGNAVIINGNVKINDKDSSGNAVSGNKVTIAAGNVNIAGIDGDHKVVINNVNRGVNIRAINEATLTSNDTTPAGTTTMSANADNSVSLSNVKIIAGRETQTGKGREINLQGGKISIANTRLEADGDQWDGVSMNAFTSFDKTTTDNNSNTATFTMAADKSTTVIIADSTIISPEITVTGSQVGVSSSFIDASDFVRMVAADKLVRTKTVTTDNNLRTEAVTATEANTLSLTDSSIKMNSFTGLWSDDTSSYNDSYDASVFSDTRKDIQLVGGKVSLSGYKTSTDTSGTTHTLGTIYDVSKNTDMLLAAGTDIQYAYSSHNNLGIASITNYSATAANTVTIDVSTAPTATYASDAIITGQDVSIIGGAVKVTGNAANTQPMFKATETATDTGNVGIFAANTLSYSTNNGLQVTAAKDNVITLGSSSAPVNITADKDVNIIGGAVTIAGSDSNKSTIATGSDINVYAANSYSKKTSNFANTVSASPDNTLTLSNVKMTVSPSGGDSDDGIKLMGGKVNIADATLDTTGTTIPGQGNPTAVTIAALTSGSSNWTTTTDLINAIVTSTNTVSLSTAAGNSVNVVNSSIASPDVSIHGNTVKLDNVQIKASDYIGMYAINTLNSTEVETAHITQQNPLTTSKTEADKESYQLAATAANTLDISNSSLKIDSSKATPYENIQTDIQLVGGTISLENTTHTTNNTTDVLIAAGNTVEYQHRLHELTDANIKTYSASKNNTVTLKGSTLAPTNATVIGGTITVDAQSAINAAVGTTLVALNSLSQTLDETTLKSTALTSTGTYDNSINNAGIISGATSVALVSGGTITNSGTVRSDEAQLIAAGEVNAQGTVTAPSYLVLSGNTVANKSSDVTSNSENGVTTVNIGSTTYKVTSGQQDTVTLTKAANTYTISGQTKSNSVPTGQANEQPVVQANQKVAESILPSTSTSPSQESLISMSTGSGANMLSGATSPGTTTPPGTVASSSNTTEVAPGLTITENSSAPAQGQSENANSTSDTPEDKR